jgi:hypothetical protein
MDQCSTRIRQFFIVQADESSSCAWNIFAPANTEDRGLSEHAATSSFAGNAQTLRRILNHREAGCSSNVANFENSARQAEQMMGDDTQRTFANGSCQCVWIKP